MNTTTSPTAPENLSLRLSTPGGLAVEAFAAVDANGRTCGHLARRYSAAWWSVDTDNGLHLGYVESVTEGIHRLSNYYREA